MKCSIQFYTTILYTLFCHSDFFINILVFYRIYLLFNLLRLYENWVNIVFDRVISICFTVKTTLNTEFYSIYVAVLNIMAFYCHTKRNVFSVCVFLCPCKACAWVTVIPICIHNFWAQRMRENLRFPCFFFMGNFLIFYG